MATTEKNILTCLLLCLACISAGAQKSCGLVVWPVGTSVAGNVPQVKTLFPTKAACLQYVHQLPAMLATQGYISASVDTVYQDTAAVYIRLFTGQKYVWGDIRVDENDWLLLNQLGYSRAGFHNKPFSQDKVTQLYTSLLDYFGNNGYPFAKIGLDSVSINNGVIEARLAVNKGLLYHIDTITLSGTAKISRSFIYRYLDINPHDVYSQAKLDRIARRLAELPYVEQYQPWGITMLNNGANINLYLQPRRSNQVNVLVGFLPSNQSIGGKLLLTGDAALSLRNPFGNGETIGVNWQQLQAGSPRLNLLFQRPYIFNTRFGFNGDFELYKQDSAYLNINSHFGVQYVLSASQQGSVYIQTRSTTVLNIDTATIKLTKQLPGIIDMSSISLAVQYSYNNTNYRFNPRRGNDLQFTMAFGNKTIKKNNAVLGIKDATFNYASLYDSLQLHSYLFTAKVLAAHYFPLGSQATIKAAVNAGWYQTPSYFQNELFQLGGYKLLRGFDEESIYANRYAVGTAEYRYLLGQNSYLFAFADGGWARYQALDIQFSHSYIGLGFGLAFETKTGVFNISFAEGKRNDGNFDFNHSKIHLGFVSVF